MTRDVGALAEAMHGVQCRSGQACRGYQSHVASLNDKPRPWMPPGFPDRHYDPYRRDAETFLASDWLAEHDARVRAEERERIAQAIEASTEGIVEAYDAHWITVSDAAAIAREGGNHG